MVPLDLPQSLSCVFELGQVGLLHVVCDGLLTLTLSSGHLLPSLLKFHFAPFEVAVDGVAEDRDLAVQLFVLSVIKLWLEPVSLRCLELIQLVVNLLKHVLHLLSGINPDGW